MIAKIPIFAETMFPDIIPEQPISSMTQNLTDLSIPSSDLQQHPRLEEVIQQFSPPSPVAHPSDPDQPSSGQLVRRTADEESRLNARRSYQTKAQAILKCKKLENETLQPVVRNACVTLNLAASKLRTRRHKVMTKLQGLI